MANKTVTLDLETAKLFLKETEVLKESVKNLRQRLLLSLPEKFLKEGSDLWWEREVWIGEEEIKKGQYETYKSAKHLIADLHRKI